MARASIQVVDRILSVSNTPETVSGSRTLGYRCTCKMPFGPIIEDTSDFLVPVRFSTVISLSTIFKKFLGNEVNPLGCLLSSFQDTIILLIGINCNRLQF